MSVTEVSSCRYGNLCLSIPGQMCIGCERDFLRSKLAAAEQSADKYQEWLADAEGRAGMLEVKLAAAEERIKELEEAQR